jgi:hypothetical protein
MCGYTVSMLAGVLRQRRAVGARDLHRLQGERPPAPARFSTTICGA